MTTEVSLTPRQAEALRHLCADGPTDTEIAARMGIKPNAVKTHIGDTLRAAGYTTRIALVVAVLRGRVQVDVRDGSRTQPVASHPGGPWVHRAPRPHDLLRATACCHRLVSDLPARDLITRAPDRVTCTGQRTQEDE